MPRSKNSKTNEKYFKSGVPFQIYTPQIDYYSEQNQLLQLHNYMVTDASNLLQDDENVDDWYFAFITAKNQGKVFTSSKDDMYNSLWQWISNSGSSYESDLRWVDEKCNSFAQKASCDPKLGVKASRVRGKLRKEITDDGRSRYDTMSTLREEIKSIQKDIRGMLCKKGQIMK